MSDFRRGPCGSANPRVYSDEWADTLAVLEAGDEPLHGETERIIRETWEEEERRRGREAGADGEGDVAAVEVQTAVVRPSDIYGRGIGVGRKSSFWVPWYVREVLGTGEEEGVGAAFFVGQGGNRRGWVHLEDVVDAYLRLVERAAEGCEEGWGKEGYYHITSQEYSQFEVAEAVGRILHKKGLIKEKNPKQVPLEQVDKMLAPLGFPLIARYLFASNARTVAKRTRALLGWEPKAPSLWEALEQDIDDAINAMGDRAYFRLR
ncbi:NAD-dependent epimerase/dehydratase [Macrophomina phaseolina MS6]|uniref:NAD-dependent epimerase/dehydratase n=2 Tax=Macrophomina phaseolina TaxID=35725 RepID=K2S2B9_MACPH|nr:NAD-dependent epimerase/dehydratase [Macrophomina phaseolina MS6]